MPEPLLFPCKGPWLAKIKTLVKEKFSNPYDGYIQLSSSIISRGRLTMHDQSDEDETNAWVEMVWKTPKLGLEAWPKVLRPCRPEPVQFPETQQAFRRNKDYSLKDVSVDLFDNPPVFLQMKDIWNKTKVN